MSIELHVKLICDKCHKEKFCGDVDRWPNTGIIEEIVSEAKWWLTSEGLICDTCKTIKKEE